MGNTRGLTDKPITREVIEEDGRVVAAHLSDVVTDPTSADAVQIPDPEEYPSANQTQADPLRVHEATSPADALDPDDTSVNEVQRIDPTGTVSGGTYDVVLAVGTPWETAFTNVPFDDTVAEWNARIAAAGTLDGAEGVVVVASGVGVDSGNLDFTFQNELGATDLALLTVDDANITGGGTLAAVEVTKGVHADA